MKAGRIICLITLITALLYADIFTCAAALAAPQTEIVNSWNLSNCSVVLNRNNNLLIVKDYSTDLYTLMAPDGTKLTSEPYISMHWDKNMFTVQLESGVNKRGLIDGTGKLVIPMQYQDITVLSDRWQLAEVYVKGNLFSNEFKADDGNYYKFGHCDVYFDGQLVGQLKDRNLGIACGAYLWLNNVSYDSSMTPSKYVRAGSGNQEYDFTDHGVFHMGSGQQVGVPECTLTADDVSNSIIVVDGNIVDLQGNLCGTLEKEYDYVSIFRNGYAEVELNGKVGLIDATGREIVPCEYDEFSGFEYFVDGFTIAIKDGKVGYLNEAGEVTCEFKYTTDELINYNWSPMTWKYNDDDSITVISAAVGELPYRFENVNVLGEGGPLFSATIPSSVAGVFDMYGHEIIPANGKYNNVYDFNFSHDGSVIVAETEFGYPTIYQLSDAYGLQSNS